MSQTQKAIEAQEKYCSKNKLPHFAPHNGNCYICGKNIYEGQLAISVEQASSSLITGCPYCGRSYCD